MKNLFYLLAALTLFACTKETQKTEKNEIPNYEEPIQFRSEIRETDFSDFENELVSFWSKGLEEYSLETFCSCECDAVYASQDMIENYSNLLPSIFDYKHEHEHTCEELKEFMSLDCNFTSRLEYKNFIQENLIANDEITQSEIDLVLDILNDIELSQLDITNYRQRWDNLPDNSVIDNYYSALIIEIANSGHIFLDAFGPQNDDEEIEALWNKVGGAIIGGALALTIRVCAEGCVSNGDIVDTVVYGAIGGAIRSL